jgi:hypothetical protein
MQIYQYVLYVNGILCCGGQSQSNFPDEWFCHETQCRIKTETFLVVYLEVYIYVYIYIYIEEDEKEITNL